jgi:CRP-like cAMP-binding protein
VTNPVVEKLNQGARLSAADEAILAEACSDVRSFAPRADVILEGARPDNVHAVLEGFACRYKLLPDGGRQIMAWLVPGDFCDLHVAILGEMDHGIATLSGSKIAFISRVRVEGLIRESPALARALWWATLVDEAILREWLVNMGRRAADKKVAHLFCELLIRLRVVGLATEDSMDLPLTQVELADTVGLSSVHVNRVVQHLRDLGLISWRDRTLKVRDVAGLKAFAGFDPNYLHLHIPD